MKVRFILSAHDPRKLAEFYSISLSLSICPGFDKNHYVLTNNEGIFIDIYVPSSERDFPSQGRAFALCLENDSSFDPLPDLKHSLKNLLKQGASLIQGPSLMDFGAEAWLSDPEGNQFLIYVPKK